MRMAEKAMAIAILTGALVGGSASAAVAQSESAPEPSGSESSTGSEEASQAPAESEASTEEPREGSDDSSPLDYLTEVGAPLGLLAGGLLG